MWRPYHVEETCMIYRLSCWYMSTVAVRRELGSSASQILQQHLKWRGSVELFCFFVSWMRAISVYHFDPIIMHQQDSHRPVKTTLLYTYTLDFSYLILQALRNISYQFWIQLCNLIFFGGTVLFFFRILLMNTNFRKVEFDWN